MLVSIVIPCYNAIDKIGRCINSLEQLNFSKKDFEVIFVDDRSTDGTFDLLSRKCTFLSNWDVLQLEKNSGSPSKPRNVGIERAQGEYIYFLDCDDEILPDALSSLYNYARAKNACLVRSELLVDNGKKRILMNDLSDWSSDLNKNEKIKLIISKQSTVVTSFIRTKLLIESDIKWPEMLRMGEDTVFLAQVMVNAINIEYLSQPTFVYYKIPSMTPASTQRYGRRELMDHIEVWSTVNSLLLPFKINYIEARLHVGLRVALEALIFKNRRDIDFEAFSKFSSFISDNWGAIAKFNFSERLLELLCAIKAKDFEHFGILTKPRLLIAGQDLKFIEDATTELEKFFNVSFDRWTGHSSHDEAQSRELLDKADYIWCEWLLKNAEWYSENKKYNQKLIIRMHRMELGRDHGENLNIENVECFVAVSTYFFERLIHKFPNIPRAKVRLIHNYTRTDDYQRHWHDDRKFTIGIIGILPSRKGYKKALNILAELKRIDSRFNLKVFGKRPEELAWVSNDAREMKYFNECDSFIDKFNLASSIDFAGHVDIKKELANNRVGFILSVSDPDDGFPGPESFHLAIADGFSGGAVSLVLHWQGAEYIWPENSIMYSEEELITKILHLSEDLREFEEMSTKGKEFVDSNYNVKDFVSEVNELFLEFSS